MARKEKGIRRQGNGWRVYVRIAGHLHRTWYPFDTPRHVMQAWLEEQRQTAPPTVRDQESGQTTLAQDIAVYLERVQAITTIGERTRHLRLWADRLGPHRSRHDITATEIDVILQEWLLSDSARGRRMSPSTVKRRRTDLLGFYTRMNGKLGINPVKGSISPQEPKPSVRAIPYDLIEQALTIMAGHRHPFSGQPSLAAIRARVIAYTGLPPATLMKVRPGDLQLRPSSTLPFGAVRIAPRLKGTGIEARTLPLTEQGLSAFVAFHEADAYGPFSTDAPNIGFQSACRQIGVTGVRLYDLRHSFLTEMYRRTRDQATVARLALHAAGSPITARYTQGAAAEIDAAAVVAFSQHQTEQRRAQMKTAPGTKSVQKVPQKVPLKR